MDLSERAEELLEQVWLEREDEKEARVLRTRRDDAVMKELARGGFADVSEGVAQLTDAGWKEAAGCIRRHRLAERLMTDVLRVRKGLVHEVSCRFEHLLHKGLESNACTLLGHPKVCPHAKAIPEGKCCREYRRRPGKLVFPASELDVGQPALIAYIHTHQSKPLQKLMAMGALPGTKVSLIQRFPSYVLQLGQSQFAMDREMADHIYVRPAG